MGRADRRRRGVSGRGVLVARGAAGVELATGTAVGIVAASVDVAILAASRAPFQPLFIVSNAGRILAGGIGGWLAARRRQGRRLVVVRTIDAPIDVVFRAGRRHRAVLAGAAASS